MSGRRVGKVVLAQVYFLLPEQVGRSFNSIPARCNLTVIDEAVKQPYASVELAGLNIEMTGWIILDRVPGYWQQGRIADA